MKMVCVIFFYQQLNPHIQKKFLKKMVFFIYKLKLNYLEMLLLMSHKLKIIKNDFLLIISGKLLPDDDIKDYTIEGR